MKAHRWVLTAVMAITLGLVGCKKEGSVDTAQLEASFKTSDTDTKSDVDKAVTEIKNTNYSGALANLKGVAAKAKLTPDQQQAVKDTVAQIEKELGNAVQKVAEDANKGLNKVADGAKNAVDDAKKALSK
jgi:hypothetical protein